MMSANNTSKDNVDYEQKYSVKRIVDKRYVGYGGRGVQYLVKWLNYEDKHNTWEPLKNLEHCQQDIDDYERRKANSKAMSQRKRSKSVRKKTVNNKIRAIKQKSVKDDSDVTIESDGGIVIVEQTNGLKTANTSKVDLNSNEMSDLTNESALQTSVDRETESDVTTVTPLSRRTLAAQEAGPTSEKKFKASHNSNETNDSFNKCLHETSDARETKSGATTVKAVTRLKAALNDMSLECDEHSVRLPVVIANANNAQTVTVNVPPNESVYSIIGRAALTAQLCRINFQEVIYRELSEEVKRMTCETAVDDNRRVCIFTDDTCDEHMTRQLKKDGDHTAFKM